VSAAPASGQRLDLRGETTTRRVVTASVLLVLASAFGFSFGNVHALCAQLGVPDPWAWLVAPTVDVAVIGLLVGVRHLALHGRGRAELRPARRLLAAAGMATWGLNAGHAIVVQRSPGLAVVDSIVPLLMMAMLEVGPWMLREFGAIAGEQASAQPSPPHDRAAVPPQPTGPATTTSGSGPDHDRTAPAPTAQRRPRPSGGTAARSGRLATAAEREQRARAFIASHLDQHGRPPSGVEVARHVGVQDSQGRKLTRRILGDLHATTAATHSADADTAASAVPAVPAAGNGAVPADQHSSVAELAALAAQKSGPTGPAPTEATDG
jgi:Protein of unknown function (DUF2637)